MAIKTKGTEFWALVPNSTGCSVVKIGCPTGLTGLGGAGNEIDVTCLDSDEHESMQGMPNPGQVTVQLNFDPAETSHMDLWDLYDSGDTIDWVVGFSDGTGAPTADSNCEPVFGSNRTFISFKGYVADLPLDFNLDDVVKSSMQVQRSGGRNISLKQ